MNRFVCLLVVSGHFAAAAAAPSLDLFVASPKGIPLAGIPVLQAQLERPFISVESIGVTGADGHLAVGFESRPADRDGDRGYGVYRFLLTPKDRPWALSGMYVWCAEGSPLGDGRRYLTGYDFGEQSNWSYGQRLLLVADQHLTWTVKLPESRAVSVIVKDDWGLEVASASLRVFVDLGALSHTGFGAETPVAEFETDEHGAFTLPNAGDFIYSFDIQNGQHLAPHPHHMTSILPMRLRGEHVALVYHRRVTVPLRLSVSDSKTGQPIPGASVAHVILFPTTAQGGVIGVTDSLGVFATESFSPEYTAFLRVQAPGYADKDISFVPGQSEYAVPLDPAP